MVWGDFQSIVVESSKTHVKTTLETRLNDREGEITRLRSDYEKLQAELIEIAKIQAKPKKGE
jgi:chaperonin cofactor prefoldin